MTHDLRAGLAYSEFDDTQAYPVLRRVRLRRPGLWRVESKLIIGATAFLATVFTLLIAVAPSEPTEGRPAATAVSRPTEPSWIDVNRPFHMFDLSGTAFLKMPLSYEARRDEIGTARQDVLTYGAAGPGDTFFRVTFYRRGAEVQRGGSLFVEAARSAALTGLSVIRSGLPAPLATRFGLFEVAEVTLAGGGPKASCLGFRRLDGTSDNPLAISGLTCSADGAVLPKTLACAIDRLELVSAGDDEALRRFFQDAEGRRGLGCTNFVTDEVSASVFPLSLKHSLPTETN